MVLVVGLLTTPGKVPKLTEQMIEVQRLKKVENIAGKLFKGNQMSNVAIHISNIEKTEHDIIH